MKHQTETSPATIVTDADRDAANEWADNIGRLGGVYLDSGQREGLSIAFARHLRQPQTDALKIARERITEWCDAVAVEWGQGSQTHNVARDGRDIVLAALRQPQTDALKIAREALHFAEQAFRIYVENLDPRTATKTDKGYAMTFIILAKQCGNALAALKETT